MPQASALDRALLIVGDRWNMQIIRACFQGARRFQDLRGRLSISDAVLSQRLRALVEDEVLCTVTYSTSPPRSEYRLTENGKDLWSVFVAMWSWDRRWAPTSQSTLGTQLFHRSCGNTVTPVFGCGSCGAIGVTARDTRTEFDADGGPHGARRSRRSSASNLGEICDSTVVLADRWSTFLLAAALLGAHRFSDFKRRLPGISPFTLTDRLGVFVSTELLVRVPIAENGARHQYQLTPKSLDFFVVFALLNGWAEQCLADASDEDVLLAGPPSSGVRITHRACGKRLAPRFTCNACNAPLARHEVEFQFRHPAPALTGGQK